MTWTGGRDRVFASGDRIASRWSCRPLSAFFKPTLLVNLVTNVKPAFTSGLVMGVLVALNPGCNSEAAKDLSEADFTILSNSDESGVTVETARVDFAREILPILERSCFPCHGPEMSPVSMAGFRVDLAEHAVGRGKIVPGAPDESLVIKRLVTTEDKKRMPPLKSDNPQLTAEQIALLKQWIKEGASFGAH